MLVPVVHAALSKGHEVVFLGLTSARSVLAQSGIDALGFADLWRFADSNARKYVNELLAQHSVGGLIPQEETEAYLAISFADLVDDLGLEEARVRFKRHGRQAFLPVRFLERVLKYSKPDVVVATNSPRAEQAALLAAGRLNIPSVCAVDLFALQEIKWIGQAGYATRVCVLNESVRNMFLAHGRKSEELVVTGNPAFDRLKAPEAMQAGLQLRRERGWDDGKKIVLWASQTEPAHHPFANLSGDPTLPRRVERALRDIVAADESLRLVVRYHPNELIDFEPATRVDFSPASENISTLLHAVDAVVVTASTVGLEAALAGRPVVSVDTSVFTADTQYEAMGVSRGVIDLQDLRGAVNEALQGSSPVFTQGQSGKTATQEILRVIESLLV